MRRTLIALFLYIGVAVFLAIYVVALLNGASLMTATLRGVTGLVVMGCLGVAAAAVGRPTKRQQTETREGE